MSKDPFEEIANDLDNVADTKEEIEAKREKRETAKFYYCDISRVFSTQKELRTFLETSGELPENMTLIKGHVINPVKKVIYSV